jgi:citrate/tricarballylate utilization protein
MHGSSNLQEAERLMTICNSCRYCEGLCAVFPAMELRRAFPDGDLNYLANLCHGCGACFDDCQFAPPHEFLVNVPQTLAKVRAESYRAYAWPKALQPLFDRNGLAIAAITALSVAAFILGFALQHGPDVLFSNDGRFYRLMPHGVMASLFGAVGIFACVALVMGFRNFWKDIAAAGVSVRDKISVWQAVKDAGSLRYLDGGGVGCYNDDDKPSDYRRLYHHLTFYGFLLCFAATNAGSFYHYVLGMEAPYPWYQAPKLFGVTGGVALMIGSAGLLVAKLRRQPGLVDAASFGMDMAFIVMMFLSATTGLALMLLRQTPAMAIVLAVHLGVVFSLFLTMPYGKFVHGLYRFGALVRFAMERPARPEPVEY